MLSQGYASRGLLFDVDGDFIRIGFSTWQLSLPASALVGEDSLVEFFRGKRPASAVSTKSDWCLRLLTMLDAQGAVLPSARSSQSQPGRYFEAFANFWYGKYYAHRLWSQLRAGHSDKKALVAHLMIRTYFLSRSAGVTASWAAISGQRADIRKAFRKSAIEEYAHCDEYYLPNPEFFPAKSNVFERARISPASLAFDLQMAQLARADDLGHIFVALFQERTAAFRRQAESLYKNLEDTLQRPNLFDGWRKHIGYDEAQGHAQDLETLLSTGWERARAEGILSSAIGASAAIEFLTESLSEIVLLADAGVSPQMALFSGPDEHRITLLLDGRVLAVDRPNLCGTSPTILASSLLQWARRVVGSEVHATSQAIETSKGAITEALFAALSRADRHHDIQVLGRLCEELDTQCGATNFRKDDMLSVSLRNVLTVPGIASSEIVWRCRLLCSLLGSPNGDVDPLDLLKVDSALERAALSDKWICEPELCVDVLRYLVSALTRWSRLIDHPFHLDGPSQLTGND